MLDVDCSDCPSVIIDTVLIKTDSTASNQFDEAIFCDITPMLAVFWAVNGVQSYCCRAPIARYNDGVTINHAVNFSVLIAFPPFCSLRRRDRLGPPLTIRQGRPAAPPARSRIVLAMKGRLCSALARPSAAWRSVCAGTWAWMASKIVEVVTASMGAPNLFRGLGDPAPGFHLVAAVRLVLGARHFHHLVGERIVKLSLAHGLGAVTPAGGNELG